MNPSQGSCKGGRGLPPGFPRHANLAFRRRRWRKDFKAHSDL